MARKKNSILYTNNRHLKLNTETLLLEDEYQQIPLLEKYSTITCRGKDYSLPAFSGFSRVIISLIRGDYTTPNMKSLTESELNAKWINFTGILFKELVETSVTKVNQNNILLNDAIDLFKIKFAPLAALSRLTECESGDRLFSIELQIEEIYILIVLELL